MGRLEHWFKLFRLIALPSRKILNAHYTALPLSLMTCPVFPSFRRFEVHKRPIALKPALLNPAVVFFFSKLRPVSVLASRVPTDKVDIYSNNPGAIGLGLGLPARDDVLIGLASWSVIGDGPFSFMPCRYGS
jgi:hypothetical protein